MSDSNDRRNLVRTIRLDDERIKKILASQDNQSSQHIAKRGEQRYAYRPKNQIIRIQQPGSVDGVPYQVVTRDISASGMSFLHGGYVHTGSRCEVQLITMHGTWLNLSGTVVRCGYLESGIHDIGIQFDSDIDPSVLCTAAIRSRVLVVDDEELMLRMGKIYLEQLNAEVQIAGDGKTALLLARSTVFDLVLLDIMMPELNGFQVITELRKFGYSGVIAAATGLTSGADRNKCLQAGFDYYVPKPYKKEDLANLLNSLREEPLFSSLEADGEMANAIQAFVDGLPKRVRGLEEAISASEFESLLSHLRSLKGQAGGFGFEPISDLAVAIEKSVRKKKDLAAVKDDLTRLIKLCRQARPSSQAISHANH